ncbi:hypothetical protein N8Z76_00645, partial [Gammaproteobacteria bacterium]|nr:hypothetical protein [Gammaproteobacteria bacterium]
VAAAINTANGGTPANLTDDQEVIFAIMNDAGTAYGIYHVVKDDDDSGDIEVGDVVSLLGVVQTTALAAGDFTFG